MRMTVLILLTLVSLVGCSFMDKEKSDSRYTMRQDKAPVNPPDVSFVPDAIPVALPYSRGGNRSSYEVWGKRYAVMNTHLGYREEGIASWYGLKFHGHQTANGEVYDIYKMSAAHKSLPIPSFARVTNLDNGKQVIVRVNDRGPFHGDRLIDLSYAAASRLDILAKGTGRVRVEAIDARMAIVPDAPVQSAHSQIASVDTGSKFLQVAAFGNQTNALNAQLRLAQLLGTEVQVVEVDTGGGRLHRVLVGPVRSGLSLDGLINRIVGAGYSSPILVDSL